MRTLASERRDAVLAALAADGRVVASDLAARLEVSLDTVRRDLEELAAAGALRRVHGGALPVAAPEPPRFSARREQDQPGKAALARRAAPLLATAEVLAIAGGTTTLELARLLEPAGRPTVVTNAPDVAVALLDADRADVVLLAGRVDPASRMVLGEEARSGLAQLRAQVACLGACALHAEAGLTVRHREEAQVLTAMVAGADRVVVVTSGEKLGAAGPWVVAPAARVSTVVTDDQAPPAVVEALRARGVEVLQ